MCEMNLIGVKKYKYNYDLFYVSEQHSGHHFSKISVNKYT